MARTILITGVAGFIGFHLAERLIRAGWQVVGLDSLNDYYDPSLKTARLRQLDTMAGDFTFHQMDLNDAAGLAALFERWDFERVVHLAAQAGVRYSLQNPKAYIDSNLVGFANLLECLRAAETPHTLFASSSSVYGLNEKTPFAERDQADAPVSLYAATKRSGELMAFTYSHLFDLPMTGMRFFTVYGPWGRPDMAYWTFTEKVLRGERIPVFNHGNLRRDFTYIDDVIDGVVRLLDHLPARQPGPGSRAEAPWTIYNLGNHQPVKLMDFIQAIEQAVGKPARLEMLPMQPGDVEVTYADINALHQATGWRPTTGIEEGIRRFVGWYENQYFRELGSCVSE